MNPRYRALLIEDNPGDTRLILEMLRNPPGLPFEVETAERLADGLRRLEARDFDVILLDLGLPDSQGLETFERVHAAVPRVPVVVMTGTDDLELAVRSVQAGAQDYLVKGQVHGNLLTRSVRYAVERKQAEGALRESEAKYRRLVETLNEGVCAVDAEGRTSYMNPRMAEMLGYTAAEAAEFIGRSAFDFMGAGSVEFVHAARERRGQGVTETYPLELLRKDGSRIHAMAEVASIPDVRGAHAGSLAAIRDVTKARRAEERIRQLNRVYHTISEVNQLIVRERDRPSLLEGACRILIEQGGFRLAWVGVPDLQVGLLRPLAAAGATAFLEGLEVRIDDSPQGRGPHGRAFRDGAVVVAQDWTSDASLAPWRERGLGLGIRSSAAVPIVQGKKLFGVLNVDAGEPDAFDPEVVGLLTELAGDLGFALLGIEEGERREDAERATRQSEEALRASEAKYRRLHESMMDGFCRVDLGGRILESNGVFQSLLGYSDEELQALSILEVTPERWHSPELKVVEQVLRRGYSDAYEKEYRRKDGTTLPVEIRIFALRDDAGTPTGMWAIVRDITERKRTEEALRASERKYKHFFEQDLAGHYVSAPDGRVVACNSAFARILGFASAEEAMGADMAFSYLPSRAREDFLRRLRVNGRVDRLETELRRKDGAAVAVIESAVGVHDDRGELQEIQGFLLDDTERKEVEAEFRQAQKMEAVGRLAGGVAHDFNNLLGVIMGHTELLKGRLADGDPKHAKLEEIRKAAERGAGLTRQLLAFSRKQVLQPRVLDLKHLVKAMESMLRRLIGEDIRLMTVLPDGLGQVMADEGQIEQVLMNLAVNARDAMPHGGTLTIETGHTPAGAAYSTLHPEVVAGPQFVLSVHDTGHGMDATTLAHIFEPFFTTKEEGKGTGLGLATVYGVVKQSGGHIEVESAPGEGATFRIHLPMLENAEPPVPAPPREASVCGGSETVLLLEDDEALRSVTQEILERAGYRMIVAARPEDALATAVAHPGQIDLLLSDVILPGMNGPRFAAELLARWPEIRVLFVSGYTDDAIFKPGILEAGLRLLQKPFTAQALLQAVRAALDDPATTPGPR